MTPEQIIAACKGVGLHASEYDSAVWLEHRFTSGDFFYGELSPSLEERIGIKQKLKAIGLCLCNLDTTVTYKCVSGEVREIPASDPANRTAVAVAAIEHAVELLEGYGTTGWPEAHAVLTELREALQLLREGLSTGEVRNTDCVHSGDLHRGKQINIAAAAANAPPWTTECIVCADPGRQG